VNVRGSQMGLEYGQRPGAGRLDRLQGCSPPWKM